MLVDVPADGAMVIVTDVLIHQRTTPYFFGPQTVKRWKKGLLIALASGYVAIDRHDIDPESIMPMTVRMHQVWFKPTIAGLWLRFTNHGSGWEIVARNKFEELSTKKLRIKDYGCDFLKNMR